MKKICISIIMILGILSVATIKVKAAEAQVNIGIVGEIKKDSNIDIVVDLQKMTNLYAASMEYTYDNSIISVESIVVSSNINNGNIYEAYNETANGGNKARYGYTNLGDFQGFSGDSNFLVIKAKVLKDGEVNLTKDNLKVKLVQKQNSSEIFPVVNYPKESWQTAKAPTGGTTTYTSIEAKANSLSSNNLSTDNAPAVTPENKDSVATSETKDPAVTPENKASEVTPETQATADQKGNAATEATTKDNASQAEENQNKDETSNYWIITVIVVALIAGGGFFVYKRRSLNKNKVEKL